MPASRRTSTAAPQSFYDDGDFVPGERIGPARRRSGGVVRALVLLAIAGGGGWFLLSDQTAWPGWLQSATAALSPAFNWIATAPAPPPRVAADPPLRVAPGPTP